MTWSSSTATSLTYTPPKLNRSFTPEKWCLEDVTSPFLNWRQTVTFQGLFLLNLGRVYKCWTCPFKSFQTSKVHDWWGCVGSVSHLNISLCELSRFFPTSAKWLRRDGFPKLKLVAMFLGGFHLDSQNSFFELTQDNQFFHEWPGDFQPGFFMHFCWNPKFPQPLLISYIQDS